MRKKTGFTLIEILIVLGVITTFLISAFVIFNKVETNKNLKEEYNKIQTALSLTSNIYHENQFDQKLILNDSGYINDPKSDRILNSFKSTVYLNMMFTPNNSHIKNSYSYLETYLPSELINKMMIMFNHDVKEGRVALNSECRTNSGLNSNSNISDIKKYLIDTGAKEFDNSRDSFSGLGFSDAQIDSMISDMKNSLHDKINAMSDDDLRNALVSEQESGNGNSLGGNDNMCKITIYKF